MCEGKFSGASFMNRKWNALSFQCLRKQMLVLYFHLPKYAKTFLFVTVQPSLQRTHLLWSIVSFKKMCLGFACTLMFVTIIKLGASWIFNRYLVQKSDVCCLNMTQVDSIKKFQIFKLEKQSVKNYQIKY